MASDKVLLDKDQVASTKRCGVIMPISPIDGLSSEHWIEVKGIIFEAVSLIKSPVFSVSLVSDGDDVGVIQKRIVQGVYESDIVVCDVSAKNPNVMFELGMRLAFDKPTVIIKDDKTDYSFDTSIIEHLNYPRDLRFSKIVDFREQLSKKILATYNASNSGANYTTFLKNFGTFTVAKINRQEASPDQMMIEMLSDLQREVSSLRRASSPLANSGDPLNLYGPMVANRSADMGIMIKKAESMIHSGIDPSSGELGALIRRIIALSHDFPVGAEHVDKIEWLNDVLIQSQGYSAKAVASPRAIRPSK